MERSHGAAHRGETPPLGTVFKPCRFSRMFLQLRPLLPPIEALNERVAAMVDGGPDAPEDAYAEDNHAIPAGYTYQGQFIDHDITLDTTTLSGQPIEPQAVFNFRTPKLEHDSVYGIGTGGQPYLYERDVPERFEIGQTVVGHGDPESYLAQMPDWTLTLSAVTPGCFPIADLLRFVGDLNPGG